MSLPYLNRGESIVMTTHRVTVGTVVYDAMLTNERLILMDSRYARFEPRMIPFSAITSVKGGKVPAGEPAIILALEEQSDLSGSDIVNLVFSQHAGEQRKEERESWVRKIIELVVAAREQKAQTTIPPSRERPGIHPTVRRWEAPEPVLPRTAVAETPARAPEFTEVSEDADSPQFIRQEQSQVPGPAREYPDEPLPPVEEPDLFEPVAVAEDEPGVVAEVMFPILQKSGLDIPTSEDFIVPVTQHQNPPDAVAALPEETVLAALKSLKPPEPAYEPGVPEGKESSGTEETRGMEDRSGTDPHVPAHTAGEEPQDGAATDLRREAGAAAEHPDYSRWSPEVPDLASCGAAGQETPMMDPAFPSATKTPESSPPVPAEILHDPGYGTPVVPEDDGGGGFPVPEEKAVPEVLPAAACEPERIAGMKTDRQPDMSRPGSRSSAAVIILILAILLLFAGTVAVLVWLPQNGGDGGNVPGASPAGAAVSPTMVPQPEAGSVPGVRVNVIYSGPFTGTIGNPGFLTQVSGNGNRTFTPRMITSIVQATIQKQDYSGDALTVEVFDNSTLLFRQSVTAPLGEVNLLMDTKTAASPGMESTPGDNRTLLGNGSLIYY